jgi:ribonuclease HI
VCFGCGSPINSGILQTHFWEAHHCPVPPLLTDLLSHQQPVSLKTTTLPLHFYRKPDVSLQACPPLNPATLLPDVTPLKHFCLKSLETLTYCQPHLSSSPLPTPDISWFIDGSFSLDSTCRRHAGYAIVSLTNVIESSPLPWGTTSQKAELIALTRALTLAQGKTANIFTDSKCAYHIHHHVALWEERGFLTTKGTPITNESLILKLLKASYHKSSSNPLQGTPTRNYRDCPGQCLC